LRALLRMRAYVSAITNQPHPEERPSAASRRTHRADASPPRSVHAVARNREPGIPPSPWVRLFAARSLSSGQPKHASLLVRQCDAKSDFLLWTSIVYFGYEGVERVAGVDDGGGRGRQDSRRRPTFALAAPWPLRDSRLPRARHDAGQAATRLRKRHRHRVQGGRQKHPYDGYPSDYLLHSACILLASTTIRGDARPPHRTMPCPSHARRRPPPLDRDGGAGYVIASPRRQPATPCPPRHCPPR
jgi:hypothetical protein